MAISSMNMGFVNFTR